MLYMGVGPESDKSQLESVNKASVPKSRNPVGNRGQREAEPNAWTTGLALDMNPEESFGFEFE